MGLSLQFVNLYLYFYKFRPPLPPINTRLSLADDPSGTVPFALLIAATM